MSSSVSFENILSPDLSKIAISLQKYCNGSDFSLHPKIAEMAYNQAVKDCSINFGSYDNKVRKAIIESVSTPESIRGKDLAKIANHSDFQWPLYDKCVELCKQHQINVIEYIEPPVVPSTMTQALKWLNMSEIKSILKEKGQQVSGKRIDLEARMLENTNIGDFQTLLASKYQEKFTEYESKAIVLKYDLICRFVLHRAYFLRQISNIADSNFLPVLSFINGDGGADEKLLARSIDGSGFDGVITDGKVCKLLPLFPSSMASINFKYQPASSRLVASPQRSNKMLRSSASGSVTNSKILSRRPNNRSSKKKINIVQVGIVIFFIYFAISLFS